VGGLRKVNSELLDKEDCIEVEIIGRYWKMGSKLVEGNEGGKLGYARKNRIKIVFNHRSYSIIWNVKSSWYDKIPILKLVRLFLTFLHYI
jgi:hypothetical protein